MGVTKTFCYCTGPGGYCKPGEVSRDVLVEDGHWADIERNCLAYLEEPVCVPNGHEAEVPAGAVAALQVYLRMLARLMNAANAEPPETSFYLTLATECSDACLRVQSLAQSARVLQPGGAFSPAAADAQLIPPAIRGDDVIAIRTANLGSVLARACARACGELLLATRQGLDDYTAHHYILVGDIAHEMHALALGAMRAVSAEKLQHVDHHPVEEVNA
jgi:hypothetical protein